MKICQIIPSLEIRHGGPSKSAMGLARALAEAGNPTELLATHPSESLDEQDGNLRVRVFRRSAPQLVARSAGLRAHTGRMEADIVHHHSIWLRTLHYAHRASSRLGARFVLSPRGMMNPWAWRHHSLRKRLARQFIHPGAFEAVDGWHATSEEEAEAIRGLGFRQPICVAPNGVNIPSDQEISAGADRWRELIGGNRERPIALFYSRFHRKKRLIELIDSWLDNGPEGWLLLIAGISEEYTPRAIEDYALRCGASGRVRAYEGVDMPPPYGIASLFLLPSHSENFGLSIAEALAHGVPTLVTDTTPWTGLNQNGAGWCVPWSRFGTALREATSEDLGALSRRGGVGREWMRRDFSWAKWAGVLSDFYGSLRK